MAHTPESITIRVDTVDKFDKMYDLQRQFQEHTPGGVVSHVDSDPETTMRMIREQTLALMAEVNEALNEAGWKPWASSNHLNLEAFRSELIDALRFLMNLMLIAGMTTDDVFKGYVGSMEKTIARLGLGYDGVTGKCPACKRAYDDKGAKCVGHPGETFGTPQDQLFMKGISYCQVYGYVNHQGEMMQTTADGQWVLADAA